MFVSRLTLNAVFFPVISEIGEASKSYCELAGRSSPVIGDVIVSLVNLGISVDGIENYAKRDNRHVLPIPQESQVQKQLSILQAGTKQSHPIHIGSHLPQLPDPHAYIRTPTHKQPVTEYEAIREKSANQKRDLEKALTKFLAKTSDVHSLFDVEDNQMFPLIACKPSFPSYLAALNPIDQVFDFEELEYHFQVANRTEDHKEEDDDEDIKEEKSDKDGKTEDSPLDVNSYNDPGIDNPYLRKASVPKRVKQEPHTSYKYD